MRKRFKISSANERLEKEQSKTTWTSSEVAGDNDGPEIPREKGR
jgi:hypothetical protein